jgi:hypothetical protein
MRRGCPITPWLNKYKRPLPEVVFCPGVEIIPLPEGLATLRGWLILRAYNSNHGPVTGRQACHSLNEAWSP